MLVNASYRPDRGLRSKSGSVLLLQTIFERYQALVYSLLAVRQQQTGAKRYFGRLHPPSF